MASPQIENGYTKIANEIMNALIRFRISGEERQCLDFIFRKTYGYNKTKDMISNSQFVEATGMKKGNVSRAIKKLILKKVVIKTDNKRIPTYKFNKNYKQWEVLSIKQPVIKIATAVIKTDNKVLSKVMDTKERKKLLQKTSTASDNTEIYITKKNKKLTGKRLDSFMSFWDAFDYKKGKAEAADSWLNISPLSSNIVIKIVAAAKNEAISRPDMINSGKTPKMAQGWLTCKRWEDEPNNKHEPKKIYTEMI